MKINFTFIAIIAIVAFILLIGLAVLLSFLSGATLSFAVGSKIKVVPITGEIAMEKPSVLESQLSTQEIVEAIHSADADPMVGAILLEINSGGGTAVASKQIVQAVRQADKPVIAYISEVGASAAYYIAAASDEIIADSDSLTGSFGAVAMMPDFTELMKKLGVKMNVITEGDHKAMGSPFEEMPDEEKALFQEIVSESAENFKQDVQEFRQGKLNEIRFNQIADGRILNGKQALNIGLVDSLGTRQDAIDRAAEISGIAVPVVEEVAPKELNLLQMLTQSGYSFGFGFRQGLTSAQMQGVHN